MDALQVGGNRPGSGVVRIITVGSTHCTYLVPTHSGAAFKDVPAEEIKREVSRAYAEVKHEDIARTLNPS
ncbi:MAG: hypothetical protein OXU67_01525 [Chloroflexota bacterium]|nr:hypothetical protein [Chloroflexota bacterium]